MLVEIVYTPSFPFYDSLFVQQSLLIAVVFLWWYSRDLLFTARTMARNQLSWSSLLHLFVTKLSSNGDSASNLKGTLPLATRPATTSYGSYESMLDHNRKWNFIIEIRLKVILLIDFNHPTCWNTIPTKSIVCTLLWYDSHDSGIDYLQT